MVQVNHEFVSRRQTRKQLRPYYRLTLTEKLVLVGTLGLGIVSIYGLVQTAVFNQFGY